MSQEQAQAERTASEGSASSRQGKHVKTSPETEPTVSPALPAHLNSENLSDYFSYQKGAEILRSLSFINSIQCNLFYMEESLKLAVNWAPQVDGNS